MHGHAGQVGADVLVTHFAVLVALHAMLLEHFATSVDVAFFFAQVHQCFQNFVAVGIGQTTTHGEQFFGLFLDGFVREGSQRLLLIQREIGQLDVATTSFRTGKPWLFRTRNICVEWCCDLSTRRRLMGITHIA